MTMDPKYTAQENAGLSIDDGRIADDLWETLHAPSDDDLTSAIGSYRSEMTDWAERRSAASPSLAETARKQRWTASLPQWALAGVAAVAVLAGAVHMATNRGASEAPDAPVVTEAAATPNDIAADNALLSSIDAALRYSTAPPDESFSKGRSSERSPEKHSARQGATN